MLEEHVMRVPVLGYEDDLVRMIISERMRIHSARAGCQVKITLPGASESSNETSAFEKKALSPTLSTNLQTWGKLHRRLVREEPTSRTHHIVNHLVRDPQMVGEDRNQLLSYGTRCII